MRKPFDAMLSDAFKVKPFGIGSSPRDGGKEDNMDQQIINFLRLLSAIAYALLNEQTAQGLFQKPWARLIPEERTAVVNQAWLHLAQVLQALTPENLERAVQQLAAGTTPERPAGFQPPGSPPAGPSAPPRQ